MAQATQPDDEWPRWGYREAQKHRETSRSAPLPESTLLQKNEGRARLGPLEVPLGDDSAESLLLSRAFRVRAKDCSRSGSTTLSLAQLYEKGARLANAP
jgi:hypothetical protein